MKLVKAKRIFDNFKNTKKNELVLATERTATMVTIHVIIAGGKPFPEKVQFGKDCINATNLNNTGEFWMVLEDKATKKKDAEGYWHNEWVRCVGTVSECSKFIEKNAKFADFNDGDDWSAQFGGVMKFKDAPKEKQSVLDDTIEERG